MKNLVLRLCAVWDNIEGPATCYCSCWSEDKSFSGIIVSGIILERDGVFGSFVGMQRWNLLDWIVPLRDVHHRSVRNCVLYFCDPKKSGLLSLPLSFQRHLSHSFESARCFPLHGWFSSAYSSILCSVFNGRSHLWITQYPEIHSH